MVSIAIVGDATMGTKRVRLHLVRLSVALMFTDRGSWLVHGLALPENKLVVVLVHLGNVLAQEVSIRKSRLLLLLLELLVEFLCRFHRVEDWCTHGHGLFEVRGSQLAQIRVHCDQGLHSECVGVCLCKEACLQLLPCWTLPSKPWTLASLML